jgi:hypothetical protein
MPLSWDPAWYGSYDAGTGEALPVPVGDEPWLLLWVFNSGETVTADGMTPVSGLSNTFKARRSDLGSTVDLTISPAGGYAWVFLQIPGEPTYFDAGVSSTGTTTIDTAPSSPVVGYVIAEGSNNFGVHIVDYSGDDYDAFLNNIVNDANDDIEQIVEVFVSDSPGTFTTATVGTTTLHWLLLTIDESNCTNIGPLGGGLTGTTPPLSRVTTIGLTDDPPYGTLDDCWDITITYSWDVPGVTVYQYWDDGGVSLTNEVIPSYKIAPNTWRATGRRRWESPGTSGGIQLITEVGSSYESPVINLTICSGECIYGMGSWSVMWG